MGASSKDGGLQSLAQGIDVIRLLAVNGPMRNMALAEQTGLSRPTISRIIKTLKAAGLADQAGNQGPVHLSLGAAVVGSGYLSHSSLIQIGLSMFGEISRKYDCTVMFFGFDRATGRGIYLDGLEVESLQDHPADKGMLFPVMESVTGRAIIANENLLERQELLRLLKTSYEKTVWDDLSIKLENDMEQLAEHGFCTAVGEVYTTLNVCAVPLNIDRNPMISVVIAGQAQSLTQEILEAEAGPGLVSLARRIEDRVSRAIGL